MNLKRLKPIVIAIAFFSLLENAQAIPPSQKAKEKSIENQNYIIAIEVVIENFGTPEEKQTYESIKNDFLAGLSLFLEKNYVDAYQKQLETQKNLEKLYEALSLKYITRTSEMLQKVIKNLIDLRIKFDNNSELVRRYNIDIEPTDKRSYNPTEYHLVYDQYGIFKNIKMGYERLGDAKRVRKEAIDLDIWFEKGKKIDPRYHTIRIEKYLAAIITCRKAKLNVIKIYQLLKRNDVYSVQVDQKDNKFAVESNLPAVLDPRIPDEYKIDASDANNLVYDKEMEVKAGKKPDKKPDTTTGGGAADTTTSP